jgi:lysophospholipase L1-like esterase
VYERQRVKFIPVDPKQDQLFREQQQRDPDAFFRESIAGLCGTALSNGVQPVLLFLPLLTDLGSTNVPATLRAKTQVSRELGVPLVDVTADLADGGRSLYLDADPVHFNAQGNAIIARRVLEAVEP